MGAVKNHYHDDICREAYFRELGPWEPSDCTNCDGFGRVHAEIGFIEVCDECGDERGHK